MHPTDDPSSTYTRLTKYPSTSASTIKGSSDISSEDTTGKVMRMFIQDSVSSLIFYFLSFTEFTLITLIITSLAVGILDTVMLVTFLPDNNTVPDAVFPDLRDNHGTGESETQRSSLYDSIRRVFWSGQMSLPLDGKDILRWDSPVSPLGSSVLAESSSKCLSQIRPFIDARSQEHVRTAIPPCDPLPGLLENNPATTQAGTPPKVQNLWRSGICPISDCDTSYRTAERTDGLRFVPSSKEEESPLGHLSFPDLLPRPDLPSASLVEKMLGPMDGANLFK
ncbi:hypothetical protein Tco_0972631 [Tanacetum coccineum]